ncbi:N-acetylmuramoyl-L-alanine amidase [uncultured Bacteroides sp.]|uniref:N-acetylmuramoyl-L-alanine amidase n=1 Tax=uncultured Bacteroides sp. TaxID=162156 RepID=UPI002AAAE2BF|nr:N-acetylmuramoyl-L-alanine amidase [uncultured Bacteroides sp.]
MKVLIDNGHGENTAGKRSPDGKLREYLYAREIADMVVYGLKKAGIDAERIVRETIDVPLSERCKRVNEVCKQLGSSNVILVSIHCNAAGNGEWMQARGWEAYTTLGKTRSDTLAECLYTAAEKNLPNMKMRKDLSDGDSDKEANFYILKHTKCPAVLTENLFQDNKEDVDFLLSSKGKQAITKLHVDGITDYIKNL